MVTRAAEIHPAKNVTSHDQKSGIDTDEEIVVRMHPGKASDEKKVQLNTGYQLNLQMSTKLAIYWLHI